ncbi:unnamed protein product [Dibothriocephalus latus]|uniref:Uncharacterized protein n=1 Tax=Dibothriocephalus latus TaxID=60516 RepID=A0A3P7LUU1_DIBLA|nr:unnamed protein product [Dibothriocephalus latus]
MSPRRANDFGLKNLGVADLYPEVSEAANSKPTDWRLTGLNSDTEALLDACNGGAGSHQNIPTPAFDLIQALDSLCLTSSDAVGESTGGDLSYPPGFDDRTTSTTTARPFVALPVLPPIPVVPVSYTLRLCPQIPPAT